MQVISRDATDGEMLFELGIFPENQDKEIGTLYVRQHPHSDCGAEVHLEIVPAWRKKWLSPSLRDEIIKQLKENALKRKISMIYSTALNRVSPKLLEFFGFTEYYNKEPKTYYYLEMK